MPTTSAVDVRAELDQAKTRPFHWLLALLIGLGTIFDGFDTVSPSYVIHYVAHPWGLAPSQAGFLVSSGLIGFAIGSLTHGVLADRFGRKPVFIGGLLIAGVFSLATAAFAGSFLSFITLRLLTGLGLGVLLPLGFAYLNEYMPRHIRNRFGMSSANGFAAGGVLAAAVGIYLTPGLGWQILYWVGGGAIVLGIAYLYLLPESAEYLTARGKREQAARLLARARPERRAVYRDATFVTGPAPAGIRWLTGPLQARYLPTTLALWVLAFMVLFQIYGLQSWTPELMIQRGMGFAGGFALGALLQGMGIVGSIVLALVADRWLSFRATIAISCALAAIAGLAVARVNTPGSNIAGVAALGFAVIGGQTMINNCCAVSYPMRFRATGEGFMLGVGRVGGLLGPYVGGALLGAFGGTSVLFVAIAVSAVLALASAALLLRNPGEQSMVTRPGDELAAPNP